MKKLLFIYSCVLITLQTSAQKVGIGTNTPAEKLQVAGNILADTVKSSVLKVTTGAGAGRVLVSDANGNGTWQNFSATGTSRCYIPLLVNSNTAGRVGFNLTASFQQDSVDFGPPRYNQGSDFTILSSGTTNNMLLINNDGLYHFEGTMSFFAFSSTTNLSCFGKLILAAFEGSGNTLTELTGNELLYQNDFLTPFGYTKGLKFSFDRYYTAGSEITLITNFSNLSTLTGINVNNGYLSAYKIAD